MDLPDKPTSEQLAEFYWHRATTPGGAWLGLILVACLDTWLGPAHSPAAEPMPSAMACKPPIAALAPKPVTARTTRHSADSISTWQRSVCGPPAA